MKLIIRSTIAALFLIALAMPCLAQNPNVAIRITPISTANGCFVVAAKNLRSAAVNLNAAYITIVDQQSCKIACETKIPLGKSVGPCQIFKFKICCQKPVPSQYICYVRVAHSLGNNEEWYFQP
jgi:hypothetical protein